MKNDHVNIYDLSTGNYYLEFAPMQKRTSSLVVDSFYTKKASVDSVLVVDPSLCRQEKAIFQGTPRAFTLQSENWISVLLMFQFFIYAYFFIRSRKFWTESFKGLFQVKERSSLFMDTSLRDTRQNLSLALLSTINLGLFLYIFISSGNIFYEDKSITVLLFLLGTSVFFLFQYIAFHFLGFVFFGNNNAVESFQNSVSTLISFFGISLYPIVLLLIYSPQFSPYLIFLGIFCYLLFVIFKLYKLIKIFYLEFYSFLYLILYLCTLEILPLTLLYVALAKIEQII